MLIGEVARQAGVNVQTLRYYELRGLLPSTKRRTSGYREYDAGIVSLVRFIKTAKELGFTLRETAELIALRSRRSQSQAHVRELATRKIEEMERRIRHLTSMKADLMALAAKCSAGVTKPDCAIIAAIDGSKMEKKKFHERKSTNGGTDAEH